MEDINFLNTILCVTFAVGIMFIWLSFYPENLNFLINRITNNNSLDATQLNSKTLFSQILLPLSQKISRKNQRMIKQEELSNIDNLLASAGRPFDIKPIEFYNLKYAYAIVFGSLAIIFSLMVDLPVIPCMFIFAGVGILFPNIWIKSLIKNRTTEIEIELPNILDLISVCMASGMTLTSALNTVCSNNEGLLIEEFKKLQNDISRGASMTQAFKDLSIRCRSKKIEEVYQNIRLSENLGTPIANNLKSLADSVRNDTFEIVKQKAAKAAVMVLFPVLFFIFPSIIIMIIGPALPAFMNS